MATVIGLKSGRELFVQDKSFFIQTQEGVLKQVFIGTEGKRRYIVAESEIEFYDEPNTQEYLDRLQDAVDSTQRRMESNKEGRQYG